MKIDEKVWFELIYNKRVFCVLSEPENNLKKMVIMSHGFRGSSIGPSRTFVDFSKLLNELGYSVLRFDQPNCGNSEGDFINSSFKEWVETIEYFGKKYLEAGYEVTLMGQSMGATATMIATNQQGIKEKIKKIILWVPDPKSDFNNPEEISEEGGQVYKNSFWQEAREMDFNKCLDEYDGKIHLVYGETDKYISKELRDQTLEKVFKKGGKAMVLPGQDHSSWEFVQSQIVYQEELSFLKE
jgi:esterase/lipase